MDPADVVRCVWERIDARDWTGLGEIRAREYWTSLGADESPVWRRPYTDPL